MRIPIPAMVYNDPATRDRSLVLTQVLSASDVASTFPSTFGRRRTPPDMEMTTPAVINTAAKPATARLGRRRKSKFNDERGDEQIRIHGTSVSALRVNITG
jgi:hypothetical protein